MRREGENKIMKCDEKQEKKEKTEIKRGKGVSLGET